MANVYAPELKQQVITEWMAGASLKQLAGQHSLPIRTIRTWLEGHERIALAPKNKGLAEYDFDGAAVELIDNSVRAYKAILRAAEDPEWIKGHSPNEAAILAGVIADKLYRLLGAIERSPAEPG